MAPTLSIATSVHSGILPVVLTGTPTATAFVAASSHSLVTVIVICVITAILGLLLLTGVALCVFRRCVKSAKIHSSATLELPIEAPEKGMFVFEALYEDEKAYSPSLASPAAPAAPAPSTQHGKGLRPLLLPSLSAPNPPRQVLELADRILRRHSLPLAPRAITHPIVPRPASWHAGRHLARPTTGRFPFTGQGRRHSLPVTSGSRIEEGLKTFLPKSTPPPAQSGIKELQVEPTDVHTVDYNDLLKAAGIAVIEPPSSTAIEDLKVCSLNPLFIPLSNRR